MTSPGWHVETRGATSGIANDGFTVPLKWVHDAETRAARYIHDPGQQLRQRRSRLCRQSFQYLLEIRIGLQPIEPSGVQQAHDRGSLLARTQAHCAQPVPASQGDGADQVFDAVGSQLTRGRLRASL